MEEEILAPKITARQREQSKWDLLDSKEEKAKYWNVKKILAHETDELQGHLFLIKWLGFDAGHNLNPPYNLDRCIDMLKEYYDEQDIDMP